MTNEIVITESTGTYLPVNTKTLHQVLEVKSTYAMWIARRLEQSKYYFKEDVDYVRINKKGTTKGFQEVFCTYEMAKHLAMMEGTEASAMIREELLKLEDKYNDLAAEHIATLERENKLLTRANNRLEADNQAFISHREKANIQQNNWHVSTMHGKIVDRIMKDLARDSAQDTIENIAYKAAMKVVNHYRAYSIPKELISMSPIAVASFHNLQNPFVYQLLPCCGYFVQVTKKKETLVHRLYTDRGWEIEDAFREKLCQFIQHFSPYNSTHGPLFTEFLNK